MASNNHWKLYQPLVSTPMQDIMDVQHSNMQSKHSYQNGTFSSDYPSSPRDNFNQQMTNMSGGRFSMSSFNVDGCPMGDNVGVYSSSGNQNSQQDGHAPIRETGIIEKLLHSYGFIQCCERQARLFFHFSQFSGNSEHLKIGDPVEFEMTYDRRTGKPIASTVTKIAPEVSEARVTGSVTTEVKGEGSGDNTGRISYENRGECFFLPYTRDDVEGNVVLKTGDAVSFQIATNQRGTLGACHIRFENPVHPVKYHGVICSLKETFGFIERADVVKEIYFHYSQSKMKQGLALGDDVEFNIQTRNGKEIASNITKLPCGTVVFEDVNSVFMRGQVLKPIDRSNASGQTEPLSGRIRYRASDHSEVEVPFGDKDQVGDFTLRHGDWVQFQLATDRRDHLKRATAIVLLDESFHVSGEKREQGVVSSMNDGFGFIRCVERDTKLMFYFTEILRSAHELKMGVEVEFTVDPVGSFSTMRQTAIRIKLLEKGTVQFDTIFQSGIRGIISKEAQNYSTPGTIICQMTSVALSNNGSSSSSSNGSSTGNEASSDGGNANTYAKKTIPYYISGCELNGVHPRVGDKVTFDIYQVKSTKKMIAKGIQVVPNLRNGNRISKGRGFIAALKDGYGFIENADHNKEIFFHFSNFEGNTDRLVVTSEVEYTLGRSGSSSGSCASAETVRELPAGSISIANALEQKYNGTVTRTMRALNPDQAEYTGLIQVEGGDAYQFGIIGIANRREILQIGDPVVFQVDTEGMATNIVPIRKKRRGVVDDINGGFGFLSVEMEDCKRLFFHMSEVRGNRNDLAPGDTVEYVLMTNSRTGKSSACNVVKISSGKRRMDRMERGERSDRGERTERPERPEFRGDRNFVSRIRTMQIAESRTPRVILVRPPRGPDGGPGFRPRRPISELLRAE